MGGRTRCLYMENEMAFLLRVLMRVRGRGGGGVDWGGGGDRIKYLLFLVAGGMWDV